MTLDDTVANNRQPPLPDQMARLAADGSTGLLTATGDSVRREIVFVKGEIRAARSDAEDEKLGMWLVTREQISEDDRALTLLAQGTEDSQPLGHLLVSRGCLTADTLERELQALTLHIIQRAAGSSSVTEFHAGRSSDQPDTLPDLFTSQIILIAARAVQDIQAKRAAVGSFDRVVSPSSDLHHMLDDYDLTPTEGVLLSRLDGTRKISNLIQLSALPEDQAVSTLYPLILSGVVRGGDDQSKKGDTTDIAAARAVRAAEPIDEEQLTDRHRQDRQNIMRIAEEVTRIDHYRALGLRSEASSDDIVDAWRKIQRRYDPKRTEETHLRDLGPQLEAILERAREANEVLSSPRDRRRYDRILRDVERERESLATVGSRGATDAAARNAIVEANVKRADELVHDGELYLAIQLLEQACALDPRPNELIKLARLLLRNPLWTNRALSCMRRAIQVDPECVDAWLELAKFWRRRKNPERERKALEKALAADPEDPRPAQMYRDLVGKRELERLLRRTQQNLQ
jgi:tetratricopeptide (TPR) repeat protein